jgi:aryl-alcohol dehydrogenase-like predicted oxidoreductase
MIDRDDFGRTGHQSSRVIFGAAALARVEQDEADRILSLLPEYGVNHIDTAAAYGDSELRLAPWLKGRRDQFFLATKTGERSAGAARASLERSLDRLGVDQVDLIQMHNLVEEDEWETAHRSGGALEALVQARDEGLVRFIGVTGHGLRIASMHRRSLERYDYDSVLLPYSYILLGNPDYRRDVDALLDVCAARMVAVQTIKAAARRRWALDHEGPRYSWYEPLAGTDELGRSLRWVFRAAPSESRLFVVSSSDARLLRSILEAATTATSGPPPTDEEMAHDIEIAGMAPLFDGGALERI